jgi:hypothetical protein
MQRSMQVMRVMRYRRGVTHVLSTMWIQVNLECSQDKVLMYKRGDQTDTAYYPAPKYRQGLDGRFVIRNVVICGDMNRWYKVSGACYSVYAVELNCMRC